MKARGPHVVFVTAPSRKVAERLAKGILSKKLAACVSLIPGIHSWYWWKGKVASDPEVLLVIKTAASRMESLRRWIRANHPYELPEFLALPVAYGDASYLKWIEASLLKSD